MGKLVLHTMNVVGFSNVNRESAVNKALQQTTYTAQFYVQSDMVAESGGGVFPFFPRAREEGLLGFR